MVSGVCLRGYAQPQEAVVSSAQGHRLGQLQRSEEQVEVVEEVVEEAVLGFSWGF